MKWLESLKKKWSKPIIGLGVVGFSSTLAACYGPAPKEPVSMDFCETMLIQACLNDDNSILPTECRLPESDMKQYCETQGE